MAVRFDCALTIENAVLGAGPEGVPALDHLGYVQLTDPPNHGQLAPDQYAELLSAAGPLGGLIDCTVDIGGTGQRMRLVHVGVAASPGMGGPEFVVAAWGSPLLPGGGQWSFLRQGASDQAPVAVDPQQGVPMVRAGPATAAPPPTSPYRFADPADVLHPGQPGRRLRAPARHGYAAPPVPPAQAGSDRCASLHQHADSGAGRSIRARDRDRAVPAP